MKKSPGNRSISQTPKQNNTLLNYFSRTTPKQSLVDKNDSNVSEKRAKLLDRSNQNVDKTSLITPSKRKILRQTSDNDGDDDDDVIILNKNKSSSKKNKRFKRIFLSSDDDDDNDNDDENKDKDDKDDYIPVEEDEESDDDYDDDLVSDSNDDEDELKKKITKKKITNNKKIKNKNKDDDFICDDDVDEFFDEILVNDKDIDQLSDLKLKNQKILSTKNQMPDVLNMNDDNNVLFKFISIDNKNKKDDDNDNIDDELDNQTISTMNNEYAIINNNEKFSNKKSSKDFSLIDNNDDKPISSEEALNKEWPHLSYKFLQPNQIKDLNGNKMLLDNSNEINDKYDPSTLFVPNQFLEQQTPAMRQWWELKSKHYDTILFFKMGKFYEFFHMDAVLCAKELKILFMRGNHAHAGFPEKSYKQYADALIQKGYKVARIEQTETPEMMSERCKKMIKANKFDKVVKREICRISSMGTRYMSNIDSDTFLDNNQYLIAFTFKEHINSLHEFGICFVDVSIGKFYLTQFYDDRYNSKLRTLISHYTPSEILIEKSNKLLKLIETICMNSRIEKINKFKTSNEVLKFISEKNLWSNVSLDFRQKILDPADVLQQTSKKEYELSIMSLGAIIDYLDQSLIINDIMSMGQFEFYYPPDFNNFTNNNNSNNLTLPNYMILDSMTMKNLEILESLNYDNKINRSSSTSSLTLYKIIDNCQTIFGKRLLKQWLCQPLCGLSDELNKRRDAIKDLAENNDIVCYKKEWKEILKKIPDLDRLLTQIHTQSLLKRSEDHPDSRAILFETDLYRWRKIKTFLNTISGFEQVIKFINNVQSKMNLFQSKYIQQLITYKTDDGEELFSKIDEKINFFRQSFDEEKVRNDGHFIPDKGIDNEYDNACKMIDNIEQKLNDYLDEQKLFLKTRITYVNAMKNRYLLEIPDSCESKISKSNENYELKSSRKGYKRYYTTKLLELIDKLEKAENEKRLSLSDIYRRLLEKFDKDYKLWRQAINCISQFDALLSLSNTKQLFESNGSESCLPEFIWNNNHKSMIRIKNLRNAFLVINNAVIPNDIELMNETLILTGPNMGGKTTLMRSLGLLVILAQIGAYVPATECQLTPVDRIFTRIGAYDIVLENESTFMVELSEALSIIKYATKFSLALIDELGSGTSTFDGTAIASTIIFDLAKKIQCCTLFSTHYHSILNELNDKQNIKLGYMSYMIENENDKDPTDENIVFLYKLKTGICNKSYGFNVAKLAGISPNIIRRAHKHSQQFELECHIKSLLNWFRQLKHQQQKFSINNQDDDELNKNCNEISMKIQMLKKFIVENNP